MIRPLTAAHHPRLVELWRRAGLATVRPAGRDAPEALAAQLATGHQTVLGYERERELLGVVVVTHDGRKGWINRLAVLPEARHRGIGRQLLEAAESWLREQGIRVIGALVEGDNEDSLRFFGQAGYDLADACYLTKRDADDA